MGRPKKDPEDLASVAVRLRLTPLQARVLDAMMRDGLGASIGVEPVKHRTEFVMELLRLEYKRRVKGGMQRVE